MTRDPVLAATMICLMAAGCASPHRGESGKVVHGSIAQLQWRPLPEFGGAEAIIYRSPDGTRVAAAFRESGEHEFTYPFDEFVYVTRGSVTVRVEDRPAFTLRAGDYAYFTTGTQVRFSFSEDFEDITMLVSDRKVAWR
jgi:uncharacterized cupin superfamily protein